MRNIKFVAGFAACGFILSFVFGLFSHTTFISVFAKAFIFALVFAVLGFGISFLANKFLLEDNGSEFSSDISVSQAAVKSGDNSKGHFVDITIKDEELPQSVSENHFVVGDNHQMLNESDYDTHSVHNSMDVTTEVEPDANVSFKPVRRLETLTNVSSKESISPDNAVSAGNATVYNSEPVASQESEKGIDTLPDISGFAVDNSPANSSSDIDADTDDDDGNFVTSVTRSEKTDAEVEIKDASLYAKAISSILSEEEN